ncbi:hypothetical protein SGPA1_21842 [Streptomyces misionensis JCM 4497]
MPLMATVLTEVRETKRLGPLIGAIGWTPRSRSGRRPSSPYRRRCPPRAGASRGAGPRAATGVAGGAGGSTGLTLAARGAARGSRRAALCCRARTVPATAGNAPDVYVDPHRLPHRHRQVTAPAVPVRRRPRDPVFGMSVPCQGPVSLSFT